MTRQPQQVPVRQPDATAPKVFITGVTGYIGGDALYEFNASYPDWDYSVLVRGADKGAWVASAFPKVRIVYGGLDDSSIIEEESANADIVLHTADSSDHEGAARAIAKGLARGHTRQNPGYWLHTSGTGILCWADSSSGAYGDHSDKVYNDLEGVDELTHLPDHAFHRNIDKIVLEAAEKYAASVMVAIICPPTIYGTGRGPVNQRSRQVNAIVRLALESGKAPVAGRGLTVWNNVHVHDLSALYVLLAETAATGNTSSKIWGPVNGYFLAENGEHVWGEVSRWVAQAAAAKGYIPAAETVSIGKEDAYKAAEFNGVSWGLNSRGEARKAKRLLGWMPCAPSLEEEIPAIVQAEYDALQDEKAA